MIDLGDPWWLLLFVPAALLLLMLRRRQNNAAVRFTGAALLAELRVPARSRLASFTALLGAALILLTISSPRFTAASSEERATVVLVMDVSGSMSAADVAPTRLAAAKAAAASFVTELPAQWRASVVAFSERAFVLVPPTFDRPATLNAIDSLSAKGGTATGDALTLAIDVGRAGDPERVAEALSAGDELKDPRAAVVVMLSDGEQTAGSVGALDAAARAARLGIVVHTIALGTPDGVIDIAYPDGIVRPLEVPPDMDTSARVARTTGGEFFTAVTARELQAVYASVNATLEADVRTYDLRPVCAAASLIAALVYLLLTRPRKVRR